VTPGGSDEEAAEAAFAEAGRPEAYPEVPEGLVPDFSGAAGQSAGPGGRDVEALGRMLASEDTKNAGARVVIAWQAVQTAARGRISIFWLLTRGDGWGRQARDTGKRYYAANTRSHVRYGWHVGSNTQCDGGFLAAGLMCVHEVGYLAAMSQRHRCTYVYRVNLYDTFGVVNKNYVDRPPLTRRQLHRNSLNIARDIFMLGTVCATFNLFSDFMHFWNAETEDVVYRLGMYTTSGASGTQGSKSWTTAAPGPGGNVFLVNFVQFVR
jgi:hypothetical protein